ncbi:hypothetical protein AT246_07500 [Bartonella henselae]|nr:hypothetical protein BhenCHDE101_07045 [Bartonella henselae]PNM38924.1 hypothetical protein AL470_006340 [Bartonella henselae str. Houston-1]OLL41036.1 hypothetical protein AT237_00135 [Bartonella henselae]OLL42371.1 hypothetical protein AT244_02685 [Bartonella henselae]OLL44220.1 hypothetical protein AT245_01650 [Bartonella henselae]
MLVLRVRFNGINARGLIFKTLIVGKQVFFVRNEGSQKILRASLLFFISQCFKRFFQKKMSK